MSNAGNSKKDRRDHAREVARQLREAERKRKLRNRIFIQGGVVVAVIAIAVVVVLVIVSANKASVVGPGPNNMASDGIQFTGADATYTPQGAVPANGTPTDLPVNNADGKAHIIEYIDWACPICQSFEGQYADSILSLVKAGTATVEFRPVAILDGSFLGTRYASRAENVAACMANYDPTQYLAVQNEFYADQPAEQTTGKTNAEIISMIKKAGVDTDKKYADGNSISDCVNNEQFKAFVTAKTQRAASDPAVVNSTGGLGTPTVLVNGVRWDNKTDFLTFIQTAVAQTSTATPTPTPVATN